MTTCVRPVGSSMPHDTAVRWARHVPAAAGPDVGRRVRSPGNALPANPHLIGAGCHPLCWRVIRGKGGHEMEKLLSLLLIIAAIAVLPKRAAADGPGGGAGKGRFPAPTPASAREHALLCAASLAGRQGATELPPGGSGRALPPGFATTPD